MLRKQCMTADDGLESRNGTVAGAAMRGDRAAMQTLWCQHRRWIAAVLLVHKSAGDQVEDLLQDVAMTFVTKIGSVRDPGSIRAWLRTVAINAARASARSAKARPWQRTSDAAHAAPAADASRPQDVALDEEAARLLSLVSQLPDAYREPLTLRAVHGLRGKHIASILGLADATVETRIARARRMLREQMESRERGGAQASVTPVLNQKGQR